ncbi:hypothetical protein GCM10023339_30080 [Alloalcanivorax gelatiniphagus]
MAQVVRSDEVRPQPWGDAGGTTRELARDDAGAWRISLADIPAEAAFTAFAGRHRVLTVVEGPVLDLVVDGVAHVIEPQRPFGFSGDASVVASVPEGPVRALDVVVDPASVQPFVTVLELGRSSTLPLADDQAAYVLTGADARCLVVGPGEVAGRCTVAVVTLARVG